MAIEGVKTPYVVVVTRNMKVMVSLAKTNMKKMCSGLGDKLRKQENKIKLFEDDEIVDEIEQNRINEELEKSLNRII